MTIRGEWIPQKLLWTIAVMVMILTIEVYVYLTPQTIPATLVCNGSDCALFPAEMVERMLADVPSDCEKVGNYWKCPEYDNN